MGRRNVTIRPPTGLRPRTTAASVYAIVRRRTRYCRSSSRHQALKLSLTTLSRGVSVRRRTLVSLALLLAAAPTYLAAQAREITGKVTQAGTGAPVTEATIGV